MTETLYIVLTIIFWVSSLLIVHTYVGYPLILSLISRNKTLSEDRFENDSQFPEVVVLMAVYNEESVLERTIESMLASDYPVGKLRIMVGSDGSTDGSHEIVERLQRIHSEIDLRIFSGRNGKVSIVNRLAREATSGLSNPETAAFVLCDANVTWRPDMLRRLVSHFKRADVGLVGASVVDVREKDREGIAAEEQSYIGRENLTKFHEGVLWGSTMGAFGACYAMRVSLFKPVPEYHIVDDFFLTMSCLEQGQKAIVDLEAVCNEPVSSDIREEFRRKRRIATGNFQNLQYFWDFIRPWNGGLAIWYAFWSHKGLRWIGPILLVAAFSSCVWLSTLNQIYLIPYAVLIGTFAVGGLDYLVSKSGSKKYVRVFRFLRYFYSMNGAIMMGFLTFCKGVKSSVWEPTRRVDTVIKVNEFRASQSGRKASQWKCNTP
tara:strand:- start:1682 stop:2980 length:1299 start_codon:yes stop_codon:yes gene_type:complete